MPIERLSINRTPINPSGNLLMMVGSYAPVHAGHIDAMESAARALTESDERVSATIFTPNSDSYVVSVKLQDTEGKWNFERRVSEFQLQDMDLSIPAFVDDITGSKPPERSISEEAIDTAVHHLGTIASKVILVVGSDQINSMKPHLATNRAICVLRPGSQHLVDESMREQWFRDAVHDGRYILTNRKITERDISSTEVRRRQL